METDKIERYEQLALQMDEAAADTDRLANEYRESAKKVAGTGRCATRGDVMTMPLVFVDTETTGLHEDKQLWEVALIRREFNVRYLDETVADIRETRFQAFVPVDISNADLFGLNVGGFYERHPLGRILSGKAGPDSLENTPQSLMRPADTAIEIARFTHGARFIAAVPSFDDRVLSDYLRENGIRPAWHYHLIDVCELAIGYLVALGRVLDPYDDDGAKMDVLAKELGVEGPGEKRHEAMADAEFAMRIYDAVMQ